MDNTIKPTTAIWLYADLETSAIGTRSRLADELCGKAVLTRTVERLLRVTSYEWIVVFCPIQQQETVISLLPNNSRIMVKSLSQPVESNAINHRKWSLESWRGGLAEMTQFDELKLTREMIQFGIENKHNVIMVCPASSPVIDPELIDTVTDHYYEHKDEVRFVFTQAAPGICGCVFRLDIVHEVELANLTIGNLIAYDPDSPHSDQIVHECTYKVPKSVYYCFSRFIADNDKSWKLLERIISENDIDSLTAQMASQLAEDIEIDLRSQFPQELEIEINSVPSIRYGGYPHNESDRSSWLRKSNQMSLEQFCQIIDKCSQNDAMHLTIGGWSEPLAHPDIIEMVSYAKQAGIFAVNIETDGTKLSNDLSKKLITAEVDIVTVWTDGWHPQTAVSAKGNSNYDLELVHANIEYFIEQAKEQPSTIVPAMTKTAATMADMEPFYNQWRKKGAVSFLTGFNYYCGYCEDINVMNMAPPARSSCNQLFGTMMILTDGTVVQCCEDFKGELPIGNVFSDSISDIWQFEPIKNLRNEQKTLNFDNNELCRKCRHWFR